MSGRGQGVDLQASKGQGCDAATRAHARAKRALWPRPEHADQVFNEKPGLARRLGWSWGLIVLG